MNVVIGKNIKEIDVEGLHMVDLNISLPDSFLKGEERDGYYVSEDTKKVWAVELDLLVKLLDVCKKYGIQIIAEGGTLLGAIRHHGFIPWDDDIDMALFRDQYERLCKIALKEFQYPYFFQTEYTDPGSLKGHAQLRNCQTTGITHNEYGQNYKYNQGIFIDIFPMDSVIEDEIKLQRQINKINRYRKDYLRVAEVSTRYTATSGIKGTVKKLLHSHIKDFWIEMEKTLYRKFERECEKYDDVMTKKVSLLSFKPEEKRLVRYREDCFKPTDMPFEFITIPVSQGYDRMLKLHYGDYMTFKQGTQYHSNIIFDVCKNYKSYLQDCAIKQTVQTI